MRVLLVQAYKPLVDTLRAALQQGGFSVDVAGDGELADHKALTNRYDLIVLDVMLPGQEGMALLEGWRQRGLACSILVLTARARVEEATKQLDQLADDYLTKPFDVAELLARVRALVRRKDEAKDPVIRVHDLTIDTETRTVVRAGRVIRLTPREYALLEFLALHQGQVVTRRMVWEHLYDEHDENTSNVVDVFIRYLRRKIDEEFDLPLILTRWGEGYLLRGKDSYGTSPQRQPSAAPG